MLASRVGKSSSIDQRVKDIFYVDYNSPLCSVPHRRAHSQANVRRSTAMGCASSTPNLSAPPKPLAVGHVRTLDDEEVPVAQGVIEIDVEPAQLKTHRKVKIHWVSLISSLFLWCTFIAFCVIANDIGWGLVGDGFGMCGG
jgi:hypothetical protein